jgi:hypothetical protein
MELEVGDPGVDLAQKSHPLLPTPLKLEFDPEGLAIEDEVGDSTNVQEAFPRLSVRFLALDTSDVDPKLDPSVPPALLDIFLFK